MQPVVFDHTFLAAIALVGMLIGILGGLYLAYDLLGGERGPLGIVTRVVTYSCIFSSVYATAALLAFGARAAAAFGGIAGPGLGLALTLEFRRLTTRPQRRRFRVAPRTAAFAALRGLALGAAAGVAFGARFGAIFGVLTAAALIGAYLLGAAPSSEFFIAERPRYSWARLRGTLQRGIAVGLAGAIAAALSAEGIDTLRVGLVTGVVAGLVGGVVGTLSPFIEYWADRLPPRRLGAVGVTLLLIGALLQSVEYWVVVLHVPVR